VPRPPGPGLAGHDHRSWHEPARITSARRATAGHDKIAAIEYGVRAQPQAQRPVPVQLPAPVFGQAMPPGPVAPCAQAALHDAATPRDHPAAQNQACSGHANERQHNLASREN